MIEEKNEEWRMKNEREKEGFVSAIKIIVKKEEGKSSNDESNPRCLVCLFVIINSLRHTRKRRKRKKNDMR